MKLPPARLTLTVVTLLLRPALYAQTPGGVNSNLSLWVKANLGAAPAGGGTLTAWTDQTGINSFTLNTTGVVPIPPAVVLNAVNFNPAIRFSGSLTTGIHLMGNTSIAMSECSAVASWSGAVSTERGTVISPVNSSGNGSSRYFFRSADDGYEYTGFGLPVNPFFTSGYEAFTAPAPGVVCLYTASGTGNVFNSAGLDARQFNINGGYLTTVMNDIPQIGDRSTSDSKMNGDIAEIVMYSAANTAALRNRVESYLALKYGITLGNTSTPINYTSSAATVFWTGSAIYQHNVFGIGTDNGSALVQTQSNSMNSGSGNGTGQSGKGNLVLTATGPLADQQFLMIGTDLLSLGEEMISAAIGPSNAVGSNRVIRNWKVQNTGAIGSVSLSFDMTGLSLSGGTTASNYYLLVDNDGDGNFTTGTQVAVPATSITGNLLNFTATTALKNGVVFTLLTLPSSSALLPMTWSNFTASATKNDVLLRWSILNEAGVDHFEVEHAASGMPFSRIAQVAATNSNAVYQYRFNEAGSGTFYYRVKAVLKSGMTVYSGVMTTAIHQKKTVLIKNNPVSNNHLELLLGKPVSAGMQINIFNAEGKQVLVVNRPLTSFGSQVDINIGLLPGGLYFVHILDGDDASTTKFIKQ